MNALIIIAIIYAIYRICKSIADRAQADRAERERQRIREEQAAIREQMRMDRERAKAETRRQIEAEKARIAWQKRQEQINRQAQAERERMEREQAAAWERQRKEDEKRDAALETLAYRIDKAEDELHHFSAVLDAKNAQRDDATREIESIKAKLELLEQTLIDPRNAEDYITAQEYDGPEGAILFAERYAKALDTTQSDRKKAVTDAEKLRKRKAALESKIITLDEQIFKTEQKIKKAQHDKYFAEQAQRKLA